MRRVVRTVLFRVAMIVPVVLGVATLTFVVSRVLPGDPARVLAGPQADVETIERFSHNLGLDKPIYEQYADFLADLARGDLGDSWSSGNTVLHDLGARFPATLELVLFAFILAVVIAVPLGIWAAIRKDKWVDHTARIFNLAGVSMPQFWTGLLLIYVFFFLLRWMPAPFGRLPVGVDPPESITGLYVIDNLLRAEFSSSFWAAAQQLILPVVTLGLAAAAPITRMVRNSMLEALRSPYTRAARAYGVPNYYTYGVYALRNAFLPVLTLTATLFGNLVGGAIVVEFIFAWPGLGFYAANAAVRSDYAALQGFVILIALLYALVFLLVDILYPIVDPRTRRA